MHIMILGSGVIGTSIAYYAAKAGHQVTVIDRQASPAMETSFANAGEVSPGYASPWAGPGVPLKAIQWLLMQHSPLVIKPILDPAMWRWGLAMLRNCTQARYEVNKSRMVRMAEYSRDCLKQLRADTDIQYDQRMQGTLQLFRTQAQLDATAKDVAVLQASGVDFQILDREGCIQYEPALAAAKDRFVGGMRLPGDETGDCFIFTQNLAKLAQAAGAVFKFNVNIQGLNRDATGITGVRTEQGVLTADQYVVATGSYSTALLKPLGIHIPVYPVKGFSLTLPITNASMAPESTVLDETYKVAVTRLGDRVRVGGTAQLSGFDLSLNQGRRETLEFVVQDLYGQSVNIKDATFWTGLRPMTPDGTPIVGASHIPKLWLSTGHGTLGWTMATGTGRVMADLLSGRDPEISMDGLTVARYQ